MVRLFEDAETAQHICLVMEHCNGGDFAEYIKQHAPLSMPQVSRVVAQLAEVLQYLQAKGVVHRDLKPHNLLIAYVGGSLEPVIKVADFGFARHLTDDMAATFCGSPLYMAPEIMKGASYDARSDLWSIGVVLFQAITGDVPFKASSLERLKAKLFHRDGPPPLPPLPTGCPSELTALIEGLLRIDPDRRISFDAFFEHSYVRGCRQRAAARAARATAVPYGDAPPSPSPPASDEEGAPKRPPSNDGAAVPPGGASLTDETSFVVIDREHVEINALADALEDRRIGSSRLDQAGGHAAIGGWVPEMGRGRQQALATGRGAEFGALVEQIRRPAVATMNVAHARLRSAGIDLNADAQRDQHGRRMMHLDAKSIVARIEALQLYARALACFQRGLMGLRSRATAGHGAVGFGADDVPAIRELRERFNECTACTQALRVQLPPLEGGLSFLGNVAISLPEELLYHRAIQLSREAGRLEAQGDPISSQVVYGDALELFELLMSDARSPDDARVLQEFVSSTRTRLDAVAAQIHAAELQRRAATMAAQHRPAARYADGPAQLSHPHPESDWRSPVWTGGDFPPRRGSDPGDRRGQRPDRRNSPLGAPQQYSPREGGISIPAPTRGAHRGSPGDVQHGGSGGSSGGAWPSPRDGVPLVDWRHNSPREGWGSHGSGGHSSPRDGADALGDWYRQSPLEGNIVPPGGPRRSPVVRDDGRAGWAPHDHGGRPRRASPRFGAGPGMPSTDFLDYLHQGDS